MPISLETTQPPPEPDTPAGTTSSPATAAGAGARRLTPNVFGISFGLAGVAQSWTAAAQLTGTTAVVGDVLWIATALAWSFIAVAYARNVVRGGRTRTELLDPVFAPFVAVAVIVPMLLGVALAGHARTAGVTVFALGLAATIGLGGWMSGQWILSDLNLAQWHPGYFLPTVAGGYLAAGCSAALGYGDLARLMFGYATVCWLVLGSILLLRLFTVPLLPIPLRPTMAIEVAPPAVAGAAWFQIDGGRADTLALGLAGYAMLMMMVQVRLLPTFRKVPFGLGWWVFAFSYAAVVTYAIHWLAAEPVAHRQVYGYLLPAIATAALLALLARTALALRRGTFLPQPATVSLEH